MGEHNHRLRDGCRAGCPLHGSAPEATDPTPGEVLSEDEWKRVEDASWAGGAKAWKAEINAILAARLAARAAEHEAEVEALRRELAAAEHVAGVRTAHRDRLRDDLLPAARARAEAAEAEVADLRAGVLAVLPAECWVTRHTEMVCTDMIGGGFENGAKWTEDMCCVPCRVRAALGGEHA